MHPSLLVEVVLRCLADHPHDNTVARVSARLDVGDPQAVQAALTVLAEDGLVDQASEHAALTAAGWRAVRRLDPFPGDE